MADYQKTIDTGDASLDKKIATEQLDNLTNSVAPPLYRPNRI